MYYPYIKNMAHETPQTLHSLVEVRPGQVVSRTLAQNDAVSLTLFAFDKGEAISTHASEGDAMALVLEGAGRFTVEGKAYSLPAGHSIIMPAGKPHAVFAPQPFKMLLTVIFGESNGVGPQSI